MQVRMISALVGPTTNHQPGDIVETGEAARWIEFGIAAPIDAPVETKSVEVIETASTPVARETPTRRRTKVTK